MDSGFWILDSGFWILDYGLWILDSGFWILDSEFSALFFGFLTQTSENGLLLIYDMILLITVLVYKLILLIMDSGFSALFSGSLFSAFYYCISL